jgi:hypothetical protein
MIPLIPEFLVLFSHETRGGGQKVPRRQDSIDGIRVANQRAYSSWVMVLINATICKAGPSADEPAASACLSGRTTSYIFIRLSYFGFALRLVWTFSGIIGDKIFDRSWPSCCQRERDCAIVVAAYLTIQKVSTDFRHAKSFCRIILLILHDDRPSKASRPAKMI